MIRSITQKKSQEEIERLLKGLNRIFIIGCGTCTTLTRTGGEPEVRTLKQELSENGKLITGATVVPVACDNLTREFLGDFGDQIKQSDALLITSCAFGVQTIARQLKKLVVPALDTLFIGKETALGADFIKGSQGGFLALSARPAASVRSPTATKVWSTAPAAAPTTASARSMSTRTVSGP